MDEENILDLIAQQLSGNISEADRKTLIAWRKDSDANEAEYTEYVSLWEMTQAKPVNFEPNVAEAWTNVEHRIDTLETLENLNNTRGHLTVLRTILRIAAAVILCLGVAFWIYQKDNAADVPLLVEYKTLDEESKSYTLPDGSKVWLNQNSTLSYQQDFNPRVVNLEGEAFFDVEKLKEKSFEIISGTAKTTVLGTSFNVRAYPKENFIEVTVETGKVALSKKTAVNPPLVIKANQSAVFEKAVEKVEIKAEKIDNANAWKTKEIKFDEVPMTTVIQTLERLYEKEIEVSNPDILNCPYKDTFNNVKLEDILMVLTTGLSLDYEIKGNLVILSGTGCK